MRSFTGRCALGAIVCSLLAISASAQEFPSRPITLSVENRAGAGGGLAAALVQNAPPDGYTLLVFSGSQHATVPAVGNAGYDPVKGFAPITFLFNSVVVLTVPPDSPAQSIVEPAAQSSGGKT